MIQIILEIILASCLAANVFMPFMGIIIQIPFVVLLTMGPPSLFAVTIGFVLGSFACLLLKYGVVTKYTKAFSGISAGAGYKRVWPRFVEGLRKVAGSLIKIKGTVPPGIFWAVPVFAIMVYASAMKLTMPAALGDGTTVPTFIEDSLVDGSTMEMHVKISTGQALLQVKEHIKFAFEAVLTYASMLVSQVAEAAKPTARVALLSLDDVVRHIKSVGPDLTMKFVRAIRHESGLVRIQDLYRAIASAVYDFLISYGLVSAFKATILLAISVIYFAYKYMTRVLRLCWKDDIATSTQETRIYTQSLAFIFSDASITILLQVFFHTLDMVACIRSCTVPGFYALTLLVERAAYPLLRLWRPSNEWTSSWKMPCALKANDSANSDQGDSSTQSAFSRDVTLDTSSSSVDPDVTNETFSSEQSQDSSSFSSENRGNAALMLNTTMALESHCLEGGDFKISSYPTIQDITIPPQSIAPTVYPVGRPDCISTEQEHTSPFGQTASLNFSKNITIPILERRHNPRRVAFFKPKKLMLLSAPKPTTGKLCSEPKDLNMVKSSDDINSAIESHDEEDLVQYTAHVAGTTEGLEIDRPLYSNDLPSLTDLIIIHSRSDSPTESELPTPVNQSFDTAGVVIPSSNASDGLAAPVDASLPTTGQELVKFFEEVHDLHDQNILVPSRSLCGINDEPVDWLCEELDKLITLDTRNDGFYASDSTETIRPNNSRVYDEEPYTTSDIEDAERSEPLSVHSTALQSESNSENLGNQHKNTTTQTITLGTNTSAIQNGPEHPISPTNNSSLAGQNTTITPLEHEHELQTVNNQELYATTGLATPSFTSTDSALHASEFLPTSLPSHKDITASFDLETPVITAQPSVQILVTEDSFSAAAMVDLHLKLAALKISDDITAHTRDSTGDDTSGVDENNDLSRMTLAGNSSLLPVSTARSKIHLEPDCDDTPLQTDNITKPMVIETFYSTEPPTFQEPSLEISRVDEGESAPSVSHHIDLPQAQVNYDSNISSDERTSTSTGTPTDAHGDAAHILDLTSDNPPAAPAPVVLTKTINPCVHPARSEVPSEPECETTPHIIANPLEQPNSRQHNKASQVFRYSPAPESTTPGAVLAPGVPNIQVQPPAVPTAVPQHTDVQVPEVQMTASYSDVPTLRLEFDQELHLGPTFRSYPDSCSPAVAARLLDAVEGPMDTSADVVDDIAEMDVDDATKLVQEPIEVDMANTTELIEDVDTDAIIEIDMKDYLREQAKFKMIQRKCAMKLARQDRVNTLAETKLAAKRYLKGVSKLTLRIQGMNRVPVAAARNRQLAKHHRGRRTIVPHVRYGVMASDGVSLRWDMDTSS
ncbi:hypothetical protein BDN72DRAFT_891360 [Pluteus cervinus]|uniref:Uncharacterized protein n=1 Tax=Pluteus cervinus TaxID=181527 RepID=A0ACD3BEI2_9AGAR|nr:hypothetical protein BDN72DRAFT_891360 [Pluteus cervinus]